MERYHIFKLGLAILFYAAYCIRPMLVDGLKSSTKTEMRPEDYLVFYQVQDGIPGVDFPILSNIPRTAFSCENIDSGYYADLDTDCQVFHICEEGKKISFLCPNGTIFDQSDLICEWWFKVNCTNSPNLYHESAELLRENLARRKASRKVYLNGKEGNHGAVMRVEESSSISAKKGSKSFSPGGPNAIATNGNSRISSGSTRSALPFSQRAIDRNSERTEQKPKRYNDADTGNYVNKIDEGKNLKDYHVQFSQTSPGLETASSDKHVWSTTPSSLNSASSQRDRKNQVNGSRGSVRFRPSLETEEGSSGEEYDLEFPKHRSEVISENTPATRSDTSALPGVQAELRGRPNLSVGGRRNSDSDELQVPQETAAFAKNSYNSLRTSSRKQPTVNPYPNHRTTYSELKQPTLPTPRLISSINSVTPQYITTQSINSGKPFVGSTIGLNIFGTKLRTSTFEPEISPFGNHISSTQAPSTSTTETPFYSSSTTPTTDSALFRFFLTSTTTAKPETSPAEELVSSTQTPIASTTKLPSVVSSSAPSTDASASQDYVSSTTITTVAPLDRSTKRVVDHATVYGSFSNTPSTTSAPFRGTEVKFGKNEDKVGIQLSKSVGETAKYSSTVNPPLLKSNAFVHVSDLQGTVPSSTVRNNLPDSSLPVIEDIYRPSVPSTTEGIVSITPTVDTNYPSSTGNEIQDTTTTGYKVTTSLPKISSTGKEDYNFQSTTSNSLSPFGEQDTVTTGVPSQGSFGTGIVDESPIRPEIGSEGGTGVLQKPHTPDSIVKDGVSSISETTNKPTGISQIDGGSTLRPKPVLKDGNIKTKLKGGSSTKTIKTGISVGAPASTAGSAVTSNLATSNKNVFESGKSTVRPEDEVTVTERAEVSTDLPRTSTLGTFSTVTLRGEPFKNNQELGNDEITTNRVLSVNRQSTTAKPLTNQVIRRGKPFKSNVFGVGEELTEQPRTFVPPVATVTGRGKPFASNQYPNEIPTSTLGVTIYEVFTESTQTPTEQQIGTTIQPVSGVRSRGKPFSSVGVTSSTEGGRIYEVFTESTTTKLPVDTVTRRGRPFRPTDSAYDGSENEASTEHLETSTRLSGTTILPSITTSKNIYFDTSSTSAPFGEASTPVSAVTENPKYSSAVNPPLLKSDAFVRISNVQSTSRPLEATTLTETRTKYLTESSDDQNFQQTTTDSEKPEFFFSSTAAPLTGTSTIRTYGSTVVPPLLSNDAVVHVSDIQSTSQPLNDITNSFGKRIKPEVDTVSSTALPNLKLRQQNVQKYNEDVSKYGGFDTITNRPKETFSDDINISQNTVSSTLVPDVVSFASSFRSKPIVVSPTPSISSHGGKSQANTGFYVTKNSVYDSSTPSPRGFSSTLGYEQSTPFVNISPLSGERGGIQPPQVTLSAPKVESTFEKEVSLVKSESQWPRPFQRPNSLDNKERATYLPTESTTSAYVTYKISSARPFMLPEGTPAPTVPSPFTAATPSFNSVYENVDNMINMLKEIVNATDEDFSSETPRPGLIVPPSAGPQTLHTLAVYFANALDGIAAEREKLTGEELDEENKEKLTSLLTQMTMYRYKELFKGKDDVEDETTTVIPGLEDDSDNLIQGPGLRQLARNFSLALSSYLDNPEMFRKDLESLRPTEPPQLSDDATEGIVGDEELLNFSDADTKPSFPAAFPTLPSVTPTWGYIIAPKGDDFDVKNSLNPDLHTSDTQSFVPGFNNLPASSFKSKDKSGLPEDHWTDSPGATKLWQTAFSVNPVIVNDHFVTTEPTLLGAESTESYITERSNLPRLDIPQSEVRYDLRALPKVSVNATEVRGLLIDFLNTTKDDQSNRLQRLLRKLNTTENEFLNKMKEIDSNPLTKRLVLLLISECGTNATRDIADQAQDDLSEETLEASQSGSSVASYRENRRNSDIHALVDPTLHEDNQDKRALQLLNSLYTIAAKFGK